MILLLALPAFADIGPPPTCPAGQHREYLYGNHCVKDGFHLVAKEGGGGWDEVADPTPVAPTVTPTDPAAPPADAPSTAIPEVTPAAAPTPVAAPPPESRCATAPGTMGLGLVLASLLAGRRRRASTR